MGRVWYPSPGHQLKTPGAIKHKLNQVRFRHLKKRIEAELRKIPGNCRYNAVIPPPGFPTGGLIDGMELSVPVSVPEPNASDLGICLYGAGNPDTWKPTFCDEHIDGGTRARGCPLFCARKPKEVVKDEFTRTLEKMTLPEVAYHYPDMAALIWVLDESDIAPSVDAEVVLSQEEDPTTVANGHVPGDSETVVAESEPSLQNLMPEKKPWWARWLGT